MKIRIKTDYLTESPYQRQKIDKSDGNKSVASSEEETSGFTFKKDQLEALSEELINSHPTSILISGFRGVGKTSYIEKLEECMLNHKKGQGNIFVKLNFSKYEEYKFIIRKLIRNLYLALKKSDHWPDESTPEDKNEIQISKQLRTEIESLYANTYLDVSEQLSIKKEESKETIDETKLSLDFKKGLKLLETLLYGSGATALLTSSLGPEGFKWIGGALAGLTLIKGFEFSRTITEKQSTAKTATVDKSTIYDDEIADYLFTKVIDQLQKENVRLVFVLDELDKIQKEEDINKVINELKPFLLSGKCNYILVSGQDLYYQYFKSSTENDPVISSVFSRFFHVGLPNDLLNRLDNLMSTVKSDTKNNPDDEGLFYDLKQALIFDSHRLPRKLVSTLRKTMAPYEPVWEEGFATVDIDNSERDRFELKRRFEQSIHATIDALNTDSVIRENKPIRDLFINQFYIWANELMLLQENREYSDAVLLRETSPWSDKLQRLKDKREIFLITFLKDLEKVNITAYNSEERSFKVSFAKPSLHQQSQEEETVKSRVAPLKKEQLTKEEETVKLKKSTKKKVPTKTAEKVNTKKTRASTSKSSEDLTLKAELVQKPGLTSESQEFLESFESLLRLAAMAANSIELINSSSSEVVEFESEFYSELETLIEYILNISGEFETIQSNYNVKELAAIFRSIQEENTVPKIPSDFSIRISRAKNELLRALFIFHISEMEMYPSLRISTEEIVILHATGSRFPNLDLFIQPNIGTQVAMKFIAFTDSKTINSSLIDELIDFLIRANKMTNEIIHLVLIFWSDNAKTNFEALETQLRQGVLKISAMDFQLVTVEFLRPDNNKATLEIFKRVEKIVDSRSLYFGHRYFPFDISNIGDKVNISTDSVVGSYQSIKKDQTEEPLFIQLEDYFHLEYGYLGVPHLLLRIRPVKDFCIFIKIQHDELIPGFDDISFCLRNNEPTVKREGITKFLEVPSINLGEGWLEYDINLYREFQNSYWTDHDLRFKGLERLEITGFVDISMVSLYFDKEDHSYDAINITTRE